MKKIIIAKITEAIQILQQLGPDNGGWPADMLIPEIEVSYPANVQHGDYAVNIAMKLAKVLKQSPGKIGEQIKAQIEMEGLEKIEIVPPGFINIFVNEEYLVGGVRFILEQKTEFGKNRSGLKLDGTPKKYLVEFLSANPTGPVHAGNGRGGFGGDVLSNVLRASNYDVISEYYFNDAGNQVDVLAESVLRRYLQLQGVKIDYPDELYKGDYINDLAKQLNFGNIAVKDMPNVKAEIKTWAVNQMLTDIKNLIANKLKIHYDVWKSEKSLYDPAKVEYLMKYLQQNNLIYEQDGATWFRSSQFGDDKDRVIIKSNGLYGYIFPDILYIMDKFHDRKIDHWIIFLGADHHGYAGRLQAAMTALGYDKKLDIIFVQLMRLIFNGKELRMSKRKGTFVTLEELVDEVGLDVVRWFFLMHDANTHMDFDLNLAHEQSENNPVYYVQYAHARICSILAKVPHLPPAPIHFTNPAEEALVKTLFQLPEIVEDVAQTYQLHHLPQYALDVARAFHKFYSVSRVIDEGEINRSRLQLIQATQIVLQNSLTLMGITAPTKM